MKNIFKQKQIIVFSCIVAVVMTALIVCLIMNNENSLYINAAKQYIEDKNISIDASERISLKQLINEGYLQESRVKKTYADNSYVEAENVKGKIKYTVILLEDSSNELSIVLNHKKEIFIDYGQPYIEYGAKAYINGDNISNQIIIDKNQLNKNKIGVYNVIYRIEKNGIIREIVRMVHIVDRAAPDIVLNGSNETNLIRGNEYIDPGFTAMDNYDGYITNKVVITGTVNSNKNGRYVLTYEVKDSSGNLTTIKRTVNITDSASPVIHIKGADPIYLEWPNAYVEPGFTATDIYDGYITNKVSTTGVVDTNKIGQYTLIYSVFNSKNKNAAAKRTVIVRDTETPKIDLNGAGVVYIEYNAEYSEPGASATDNHDGELTNKIKTDGSVNTKRLGIYYITYTVADESGNQNSVQRKVIVGDTTKPIIHLSSDKVTVERGSDYNVLDGVSASDNHDGNITNKIIYESIPILNKNIMGTYKISYTVKDLNGNISETKVKEVIVDDTLPPEVTINYSTKDPTNQSVKVTVVGNEDIYIDGYLCVNHICTKNYGGNVNEDIAIRDTKGNITTASINISNINTEAVIGTVSYTPGILTNQDVTVTINSNKDLKEIADWNKVDNRTFTKIYKENAPDEIINIQDIYGNNGQVTVSVIHIDKIPPAITIIGGSVINHEVKTLYADQGATATDNITNNMTVTSDIQVDSNVTGTYSVIYTATDEAGNKSTLVRTVNVVDTVKPVITVNPASLELNSGELYDLMTGVTATDNYDGNINHKVVVTEDPKFNKDAEGTYKITYNVSDNSGNSAVSVTRDIIVKDKGMLVTYFFSKGGVGHNGIGNLVTGNPITDDFADTITDEWDPRSSATFKIFKGSTEIYSQQFSLEALDLATGYTNIKFNTPSGALNVNPNESLEFRFIWPNPDIEYPTVKFYLTQGLSMRNGLNEINIGYSNGEFEDYEWWEGFTTGVNTNSYAKLNVASYNDTDGPVIKIKGANPYAHPVKSNYIDSGAEAIDAADGKVTVITNSSVNQNVIGTYEVSYTATDSKGHVSVQKRTVMVRDTVRPSISVSPATVTVNHGTNYDLMTGVTATDNYDGNINNKVTVTSSPAFDPYEMGTYTITYNVKDSSGNASLVTSRKVIVNGPNILKSVRYIKWEKTDCDYYNYDDDIEGNNACAISGIKAINSADVNLVTADKTIKIYNNGNELTGNPYNDAKNMILNYNQGRYELSGTVTYTVDLGGAYDLKEIRYLFGAGYGDTEVVETTKIYVAGEDNVYKQVSKTIMDWEWFDYNELYREKVLKPVL